MDLHLTAPYFFVQYLLLHLNTNVVKMKAFMHVAELPHPIRKHLTANSDRGVLQVVRVEHLNHKGVV